MSSSSLGRMKRTKCETWSADCKRRPETSAKPKVLAFYNHKGGVGKTTNSLQVAFGLANRGRRVLMVDLDHQMTLSYAFLKSQLEGDDWKGLCRADHSIYHLFYNLDNPVAFTPKFYGHPAQSSLHLILGSERLTSVEFRVTRGVSMIANIPALASDASIPWRLMSKLEELDYDFIVLDLPPSYTSYSKGFICTSDFWIMSAMPDEFSAQALETMMGRIKRSGLAYSNMESFDYIWNEWHALQTYAHKDVTPYSDAFREPHFRILGVIFNGLRFSNARLADENQMTVQQEAHIASMLRVMAEAGGDWVVKTEERARLNLAKYSHFAGALIPSQNLSIPCPYLTHEQCRPFEGYHDLRNSFGRWQVVSEALIDRILAL